MFETGGSADDAWHGGPPPPADRLWRHPSELAAAAHTTSNPTAGSSGVPAGTTEATPGRRGGRYSLGTVLVAGSLGALAMFGSLVATGVVGTTAITTVTSTTVLAATAAPAGTVTVRYRDDAGSTFAAGLVIDGRGDVVTTAVPGEAAPGTTVVSTPGGGWAPAETVGHDPLTGLTVLRPTAVLASRRSPAVTMSAPPALGDSVDLVQSGGSIPDGSDTTRVASTNATFNSGGSSLVGLLVLTSPHATSPARVAVTGDGGSVAALLLPVDDNPDDEMVYAVPASTAISVGRRLSDTGQVTHAVLDAELTQADGDLVVVGAAPGSGLVGGDVVLSVDGRPVRRWIDMVAALVEVAPGEHTDVAVIRGRQRVTVSSPVRAIDGSPSVTTTTP